MDWFQRLFTLQAPEHASLQAAQLSLRGMFPWWAAVLLVGVAGVGIVLLYRHEQGRIGPMRRLLMAGLRVAAVALVAGLLLRPVLVAEYQGQRPRGVALLLDNSQSMSLRDKRLTSEDRLRVAIAEDRVGPNTALPARDSRANVPAQARRDPPRADLVRAVLANSRLHLREKLAAKGPLHTYLFGQRLHGLDSANRGNSVVLRADEARTALADAIHDLLWHREGDLPGAIVIMTDGRDNASKASLEEVAADCRRLHVPLHIYGVGSSQGGILQIKDIGAPDTLFYEDTVTVPVRWRAQGFKNQRLALTLRLGNTVVVQREATAKEIEQQQAVLTFVPHQVKAVGEKATLAASVQLKGAADFHDEMKRPVRLVDRRVRVLYVESSPRWEYKFLQSTLLRDRRVEPSFLLINADTRVRQSGPPFLPAFPSREQLFTYDLLILGDVPASYLGTEHMEWIRDFVNEGGGLVTIAGRQHAPASFVDTPLAEVLPITFVAVQFPSSEDNRPELFVPTLTAIGRRSDMMALADDQGENLRTWKELPGFSWYYPAVKLRPGAEALLVHPHDRLKRGDGPMPLLAAQYYGHGESLFLATDETWRWRFNAGEGYFARFWGQVVYRLGLPHLLGSGHRAQLTLEHSDIVLGRPASVYARLFDRDYRPWQVERVP
ncbi:MAG TPA: hypothetical protein VFA18_16815, partial [Gemmataceae bacterium]|nr:hypothetical protein [Gemmataceae bacterium]